MNDPEQNLKAGASGVKPKSGTIGIWSSRQGAAL